MSSIKKTPSVLVYLHAEYSNPLYLNENYLSRTWRCLFLIVMAAYPPVTTLSLRLQDKVGAVKHNKLPQLLFHKRKHANNKYRFIYTIKYNKLTLLCFHWWAFLSSEG